MKKITLLISAFAIIATSAFAQSKPGKTITPIKRNCGMTEHENYLRSQDPLYDIKKQVEMQRMELAIKNLPKNKTGVYTLPCVVHVVYNTAAENLTDASIVNMIDLLNDDFRRTNFDAGNTPASFAGVAADMQLEFCLATTDPNGNPTNGILHVNTSTTSFSTNNNVKNSGAGGSTAWPTNQYFNIWVCDLGGGLLGYGEFPTNPLSNTYGAVSDYQTIPGPAASPPFNLNRTMTHELSHCFNLYHIWGDDGGACSGSDQINDTPNQANSTNSCPSGVVTDACSPAAPGIQYMNFMDYTFDACMNMFTVDQRTRSHAAVTTYLSSVYNNTAACTPISTANDDAGIVGIITPVGNYCSGNIAPIVNLRNYGSNTLTSVTINYLVDGTPQAPFAWTGSLPQNTSLQVVLPSITAGLGAHTFDANTTMPNATTDGTPSNDAATQTNFTVQSATGASMPYFEGFEGSFLPAGMTANNDDGSTTWAQTSVAAKTGNNSAFMDYYNYSGSKGLYDDIITPAIDLTGSSTPQVTFELAYQLYTDPNDPTPFSDTLEVLISTDCGVNWTPIYRKESLALITATPLFSTASFVPAPADWRMETISLNAYSGASNAMIMFRGIGDYENQMYIDDININAAFPVGISEVSTYDVSIYPNPATNLINVVLPSVENTEVVIFNMVGEVIYQNDKLTKTNFTVDMSNHSNGIYFVNVKSNNNVITKKVTIAK